MRLRSDDLKIVRNILEMYVPDIEVWAFGSRVHGSHLKTFSDLDLAIISDKPTSLSVLGNLKHAFSESNLPFKVDIVDWAATDESFRNIIQEHHERVQ